MKYVVLAVGGVVMTAGMWWLFTTDENRQSPEDGVVMCTMDALQCPDGSYVGQTGPNCEFVCPDIPAVPPDLAAHNDSKANVIQLDVPVPLSMIQSPLELSGMARGYWFFEGDFPVTLTNWDGLIIAEGFATAQGEWMTEDFVPFTATLEFDSPYQANDPDFMQRGSLILQRNNPSDLPENDDALEITVRFAP